MENTNIDIVVDPLGHYSKIPSRKIAFSCGILPVWVIKPEYINLPLLKTLKLQYHFPIHELDGATVADDGIFKYPNDPDQYPLIKIQRGKETFYQYEHAMIAIVQEDGSSYVTRMD